MQDKTGDWEPSTTKRKGSPETKRNGDAQIFLTALLRNLAPCNGVRWLEHPTGGLWERLRLEATGPVTWLASAALLASGQLGWFMPAEECDHELTV